MVFRSLILGIALTIAGSAWAHHYDAFFDREAPIMLTGTVVEFRLMNPHSFVYVDVMGRDGRVDTWALAIKRNVGQLVRANWSSGSIRPGEIVKATVSPLRDGTPNGLLEEIVLSDGTVLIASR